MCTLFSPLLTRKWRRAYVISEVQNTTSPLSGPHAQLLHTLSPFLPFPLIFLNGSFAEHLMVRMCAFHLYVPHSTLNYLTQYHLRLRSVYDPEATKCPEYPPGSWWGSSHFSPPTVYFMEQKMIDWNGEWQDNPGNLLRLLLSSCTPYRECTPPLPD